MGGRGIRVGKILGIEIFIDYSWIIIFVLMVWLLSSRYFPVEFPGLSGNSYYVLGGLTAILFFSSALLHELMHSYAALKSGIAVKKITLFLFGGVSELFEEPDVPNSEFKIAIAGPATSIVLALIFAILWQIFDQFSPNTFLIALSSTLFQVNLILALFNLLPGFPLDGGRILRSILWASTNDLKKSTHIATTTGQIIAMLIVFFGILQILIIGFWGGIWLILIGLFLNQAAGQSFLELQIKEALKDIRVRNLFDNNIIALSPHLSINDALSEYFMRYASQSFPVIENDKIVGVVSLNDIRRKAGSLSEDARVIDAMRAFPSDVFLKPEDKALSALKLMISNELSFVPVKEENRYIGSITLDDIAKFLQEKKII